MMKQFKKVLSILCAIALLVSGMTFALAEENTEPAEPTTVEQSVAEDQVAADAAAEAEAAAQAAAEAEAAAQAAAEAEAAAQAAAEAEAAAQAAAEAEAAAQAAAEAEAAAQAAAEAEAAAQAAAEAEAAAQAAAEAEAAAQAAEEEAAQPAEEAADQAEEPASEEKEEVPAEEEAPEEEAPAEEEASDNMDDEDEDDEEDNGLVTLEESDGYVDQEVVEEKTPAITDEFKGLREAELFVGQVLTDSLRFGDELTVTLKGCDASTIELQLYVPVNADINTKVDGKAVSFTPANSDDPTLDLFTYELTNAAGRTHEIVLNAYGDYPFQLAAVVKQVEEETPAQEEETPAAEENNGTPAEAIVNDTPAGDNQNEQTEETPAPTIQVSVKTYDVLKVGNSISDSLVAGQKAKVQVKCGKNPYVTLTLSVNPDDAVVTIDGEAAEFTAAGNGTYTCDLDEVAFRKFSVVVLAKQDLDFTLSASARQAEGAVADEEDTEEESEDINKEETAEEVTEETTETEAAEEGEAAEGEEENTEEATEEETEEEAVEAEPLTDEQLIELGYRKVQILNENGADIYAAAEEEAEVIGHADFESELWIKDAEVEGWAEIYTEKNPEAEEENKQFIKLAEIEKQPLTDEEIEALGYRKVQILNQNGTDIYDSTEEEAAVIGHVDFESELWIKDLAVEGWAEVFSEEGAQQFVKLAEIEKQMPTDEEMLEAGYIKVYVGIDIGANIYDSSVAYEGEEKIDHLDVDTELWVKLIDGAERARIFDLDEEAVAKYINLVDVIATKKPDGLEDLPTREIQIVSSLDGLETISAGTVNHLKVELINFQIDDYYTVQWKYSEDGEEFVDIEDANDLKFGYMVTMENASYIWRVSVVLVTPEEVQIDGTTQEE